MKKSILLIITCLLLVSSTFAQSGKLRRANRHFEKGNYEKAFLLYEKAFEDEKEKDKKKNYSSKMNGILAAIKVGSYGEAEYWLGQVLFVEGTPSEYWLYYAACLASQSKCDLAISAINKYKVKSPNDSRLPYFETALKSCTLKTPAVLDWNKIILE